MNKKQKTHKKQKTQVKTHKKIFFYWFSYPFLFYIFIKAFNNIPLYILKVIAMVFYVD